MTKKILGYTFFALAAILTLAAIVQLSKIFGAISSIFYLFTGRLNANTIGYTLGILTYWAVHITAIILLVKYGVRWTTKATA